MRRVAGLVDARFIRVAVLFVVVLAVSSGLARGSFYDAYAIEVVLNKPGVSYDLSRLTGAERVSYAGGEGYVYRSRYDPRLQVLLSVQDVLDGQYLTVRVQAPVVLELREKETVYTCDLPPVPGCYSGELKENVTLEVQPGEGEVTLELGTIRFRAASLVRFKPALEAPRHDIRLTVNGLLMLEPLYPPEVGESEASGYRILMPCLFTLNEACFRIMVLIPGYDAPLRVEEGTYKVKLTLTWSSNSLTRLILKRLLVFCDRGTLDQTLEKLGWVIDGERAVKKLDSATITIDLIRWQCRVSVPGEVELPKEVELELAGLLESIGLKGYPLDFARTVEWRVALTSDVDESTAKSTLRFELEQLVKEGVVKGLNPSDIELIVNAAALGYAGPRKLIWYEGGWIPYDQVPGVQSSEPSLTPPWFGPEQFPMRAAAEQQRERARRASDLLPLAVAGATALAAAATAYVLVKRVFKPW